MEIIAFTLPFIVALFLLIFFRKETTWHEYLLLILPSIGIFFITRCIMVVYNQDDTEYLGTYITKVRHYDEWDEWIVRRCTRQVPAGKDANGNTRYRTESYDCSYRQYHPERWAWFDPEGEEHWLYYENEYDIIRNRFNSPMKFVDMHRRYYRIDGDAQEYVWLGSRETAYPVTYEHSYKNKVQRSRSVFNFTEISDKEADTLGLYQYPKIEMYDQNPILSKRNIVPIEQERAIRYLNGMFGAKYQFRIYVLLFENADVEISELQRSYWIGGNKNELVVCLGLKDSTHVNWCNAFCWSDYPKLELQTEQYFAKNDTLDLVKYGRFVEDRLVAGDWQRKEFEDFEYIRAELTQTQYIWILIITLLYNIGISVFIVLNDLKVRKIGDEYVSSI